MFYDNFSLLCKKNREKVTIVAAKCGCDKSAPSRWKTGNSFPNQKHLAAIAEYFGVSVDYLLKGEESIKKERTVNDAFSNNYYLLDAEDKETVDALISSLLGKEKYKNKKDVG